MAVIRRIALIGMLGLGLSGLVRAQMQLPPGFEAGLPSRGLATGTVPMAIPLPGSLGSPSIVGRDASVPAQVQAVIATPPARPVPLSPNDFQKFVLEATGKSLPVFGADFFASSTRFSSQAAVPVPGEYPLGPGDEVLIRGWGSVDIDFRAVIDRSGLIHIPKVGTVSLAGVRASNAPGVIRAAISRTYRGFELDVSLGQLRGMTVYVVGQARQPGGYTVSSLSTLVTALFESGGPNAYGSLRRVQLVRSGAKVAEMDLYAFLSRGDKSADLRLLDGDVIVIPPASGYVALSGHVKSPAIYELRDGGESLGSLLEVAGGLPVMADPRRAFLERIEPGRNLPRFVEEFPLDAAGMQRTLRDGDVLTVLSMTPEFANAVTLRGSVNQALRVPHKPDMRFTDLVPNKAFLVTRFAVKRQNQGIAAQRKLEDEGNPDALKAVEGLGHGYDEINWDYAVVERLNRADMTVSLLPFDLGKAFAAPGGPDDPALQPGDTVTILSADDVRVPVAKRRVFVRVEGEVKRPGIYPVGTGESLVNVVLKAGGLTQDAYLFGSEFYRESVRRSQQANLDRIISRLEQTLISESSRLAANQLAVDDAKSQQLAAERESRQSFLQRLRTLKSSGRIALDVSASEPSLAQFPGLRMENGDRLIVPSRPDFVQVYGAVNTEAALVWQAGRTVGDVLDLSGLGKDADKDAMFVLRANGTVLSNAGRWFSSVSSSESLPGDIVVVPEKTDKESTWTAFTRGLKDYSQIFVNLGLGAAAIKTLRD